MQEVYLIECGTHAFVDAGFWPYGTGEHKGARRLLRSVGPEMLLMWDQGLHSYETARATRGRGAHFLSRVPSNPRLHPVRYLSDGSYLALLRPHDRGFDGTRRRAGEQMLVRVISYTLTDPALAGCGECHRLMTSLLDPEGCPALDLVCAYHERWEFELAVDEADTHQRPARTPLRSKRPPGVLQELYRLLIAHYVVRHTMHEAALGADLDPDRVSFTRSLRLICDAIGEFQMVAPDHHPMLYKRLLKDLARNPLPERTGRIIPRVVRRMRTVFSVKRAHHKPWPQPSKPFRESVTMLN